MQKRYVGVIFTAIACLILVITYVTLTPSTVNDSFSPTAPLHSAQRVEEKVKPEDIAIVMAYDDSMPFYVPKSVDNKKEYADYHGYKIFVQKIQPSGLHSSWSKITYMNQVMKQNPHISWFWWIDLDSIIMDPTLSLEEHVLNPEKIVQYAKKDVLISWDCNGINTGSFFLRNRQWTRNFLDTMIQESPRDAQYYGEQRVMQRFFRKDQTVVDHFSFPLLRTFGAALDHKCDLDHGDWKSLYLYHPGDFLVHFANCRQEGCHNEFNDLWAKRKTLPKKQTPVNPEIQHKANEDQA